MRDTPPWRNLDGCTPRSGAPKNTLGRVYLVGSGPGDPELLTVKAVRLLAEADAVVFDHLVGDAITALIPASARRIYAGKEAGRHTLPQRDINQVLVDLAREGLRVVRLKGGDPSIFGRVGEEMEALAAAGIPYDIVPGITAAAGAAAYTGFPLTHRDHAQTLVLTTGHRQDGSINLDWEALARPGQTLVIYMGLGALPEICDGLIHHGLPPSTPASVIQQASTPEQRYVTATLATLATRVAKAGLQPPSLIVVGEVVALQQSLAQLGSGGETAVSPAQSSLGGIPVTQELAGLVASL